MDCHPKYVKRTLREMKSLLLAQRSYFKSGKVAIGHPKFYGREISFNPSPITAAEMYWFPCQAGVPPLSPVNTSCSSRMLKLPIPQPPSSLPTVFLTPVCPQKHPLIMSSPGCSPLEFRWVMARVKGRQRTVRVEVSRCRWAESTAGTGGGEGRLVI